ncbi:hypothetical protein AO372_0714 [Moraxella catarrhalis]|nr:hypothetical protein AO372_0714 [Moraxella catarrhalis]
MPDLTQGIDGDLHDRIGRLETRLIWLDGNLMLHDRIGRLEMPLPK